MDFTKWINVIGFVTAIVSCATALLTYLRERVKSTSDPTPLVRLRIRRLSQDDSGPWINAVLKKFVLVVAILGLCFLAASLWLLIQEPSLETAGAVAFWTLCIVSYVYLFRVLRRGPNAPSRVRREARVIINGNYDEVFDLCESAVRKLRAKVTSLDRDNGQIHARTVFSWKSIGERVDISITRQGDTACSVVLTSDSVIPTTLVDFGKNSKNLGILVENL